MYIEYCIPQLPANATYNKYFTRSSRTGGTYRPTWLIRVSDWRKVPGTEAKKGYCALSYCWEQSGEIVQKENGDFVCVDKPRHQIKLRLTWPLAEVFKAKPMPVATKKVTYEKVLQRICKDFYVEYLWYDKVCIDQTNKEIKLREIKQMHRIYSNARFTIALVPEVFYASASDIFPGSSMTSPAEEACQDQIQASLWSKRSWTLEELMMSTDLLVVGRNTYKWYFKNPNRATLLPKQRYNYFTSHLLGYKDQDVKSASQVLYHAHFRTSSKEHDKIFALMNILGDLVSIDINYDIDISTLVQTFYRQLIERDLSVMCFGAFSSLYGQYPVIFRSGTPTMKSYNLPSWAGTDGLHSEYPAARIALDKNHSYYVDDNLHLHITCRFYTIRPEKYDELFSYFDDKRKKRARATSYDKITSIKDCDGDERFLRDWAQWRMLRFVGFFPTHYWCPDRREFMSPILPLSMTEDVCEEYIIPAMLFDIASYVIFGPDYTLNLWKSTGLEHAYVLPVLKKVANTQLHRVIGTILLTTYRRTEPLEDPHLLLDRIFTPLCADPTEFIIK